MEGRRCLNPITGLAQSVERGPFKPNVAGSSPAIGTRVGGLFQNHYFYFCIIEMKYLWIAIAVLLILLFSINVKESFNHRPKKCRLPEDGGCPVHSSNKDPPYPHPFHYVFHDENENRVLYECSKCHCQTIETDKEKYNISSDL